MSASAPKVMVWFAFDTNKVPGPLELSAGRALLTAFTINGVEPAGVLAMVVMVKVEVLDVSVVLNVREGGLITAVAPEGNEPDNPRLTVKPVPAPVAPLRFTVMRKLALPGVPKVNVPVWAPTVTVPTLLTTTSVPVVVRSLPSQPAPLAA